MRMELEKKEIGGSMTGQTSERMIQELVTEVLGVLRERAEDHFQTLLLNARDERRSQQPGSPAAES